MLVKWRGSKARKSRYNMSHIKHDCADIHINTMYGLDLCSCAPNFHDGDLGARLLDGTHMEGSPSPSPKTVPLYKYVCTAHVIQCSLDLSVQLSVN